jgi:hypothetical protein
MHCSIAQSKLKNIISDDMLGVHLRVKEEIENKSSSSDEALPLDNEMIISSCKQVAILQKLF